MGDWKNYFSYQGRLNRKPYWLMSLVIVGVALAIFVAIGMLAALSPLFWGLGAPLFVAVILASTSLAARRLHDRGKSAWWLLLYQAVPLTLDVGRLIMMRASPQAEGLGSLLGFVTFCISMWVLVDLGILKGQPGSNSYGEDPLGPAIQEVFA